MSNNQGELVPYLIEDPERVAARRAALVLPPLAQKTDELKAWVAMEAAVQRAASQPANGE